MDKDKAIRAAKLTVAGMLDKARAKTAVTRAGGQIAPSKYLPNVPRQVHADGGRENGNGGIAAAEMVAKMLREGRAKEITNDHLDAADPQHLFKLYETGKTGMDLPMDKASRMERAKALGFVNTEYHGTDVGESIEYPSGFRNREQRKGTGFWTAQNPYVASTYADAQHGSVMPLMTRDPQGGMTEVDAKGRHWSDIPKETLARRGGRDIPLDRYAVGPADVGGVYDTNQIARGAALEGHGGVRFKNVMDFGINAPDRDIDPAAWQTFMDRSSEPTTVTARQDTRGMRSQFARFDPRLAHLSHLNAATGGRIHANKGGKMGARADFLEGNHPEVPPVVYHATKSDFHDFRPMSHFGTMQAAHDRYSPDQNLSQGMSVIPAHISLKNPLDVGRERDWQSNRDTIRQAADVMFKSGRLDQDYLKAAEKLYDLVDDPRWGSYHQAMERRGADLLREAGHDGIIYTNNIEDPGSRSFVTLGPEQVKSSIGNQGTFDPTHPDMTKKDGGEVDGDDGIDAYHGSPHDFDEFNIAQLGTGEGVQAYGHGLYFAGNEGIAKHYRDALSGRQYRMRGSSDEAASKFGRDVVDIFEDANGSRGELTNTLGRLQNNVVKGLQDAGVNSVDKLDNTFNPLFVDDIRRTHDRAQRLASFLRSEYAQPDKGHMYKVKLNVQPHELLDWDAPLSEQHPNIQRIAREADISKAVGPTRGVLQAWREGRDVGVEATGKDLHKALSGYGEHNKDAADYLQSQGLKGIKYRDAGSRDLSDGDPTYNYVMFHHDPVKVVDKYEYGGMVDNGYDRIARADGGRLNLYSKAARIIAGMKDQPMQAADIVKYAIGKGAKKTEMAHVDVPPGKATPKQVADHIEFMQPQIGVHRRETFYRYSDPERYERQINYLEGQGRYDEAEELNREYEAFSGFGGKDAPLYAKYQLPGGENYREHILTLDSHPDDQTYMAKQHWGRMKNPLVHVRMSDRMIGNKKILHIEELQSDWNNDARKEGFRTGREKSDYDAYVAKMRQDAIAGIDRTAAPMIRQALEQKYSAMDPYMLAMKMGVQGEHNQLANAAFMGDKKPPQAPYINPDRDDASEVGMKHILMEAAKGGYDGIAFTPDEAQEQRWPGHTFKGIYNKKLPGMAQRLVQQHDPETDPDDMTHLQGWAVPMIPLSDKARDSIMQNGFSSFKRGGVVDAALAATRRFTKDGQHVTMRLKD